MQTGFGFCSEVEAGLLPGNCSMHGAGILLHPQKVGILGGGQLGKMLAMEAVSLVSAIWMRNMK